MAAAVILLSAARPAAQGGIPLVPGLPQDLKVEPLATLPGTVVPPPEAPSSIWWTVPIGAAPSSPPLVHGEHIFVARLPGSIDAHRTSDGSIAWRADLNPEQPLVADKDFLFVISGGAVHALNVNDGRVAWRAPVGEGAAPLTAKEGWVIVSHGTRLQAIRASDGSAIWTVDTIPRGERAAIAGEMLFVPLASGAMQGRDLTTGALRWERKLGAVPGEPLVSGDRLYFGASDRKFYSLDADTGEVEWEMRVGALVRGRPATDGVRVFFTALDNLVRAVDAGHGALRWHTPLPFRPLSGPVAVGTAVVVPGPSAELPILNAADGKRIVNLPLGRKIAVAPGVAEYRDRSIVAVVTGGLEESWRLSVAALPAATVSARR